MPLFTGKNTLKPDSRSRIGALQIGEHSTPSEDWVTDPNLPVVLKNPYGGPGLEDVVVPMGRLIAVADPVKIFTGKYKTSLTLANGVNPVIGIAPYNFCKDESGNDRFGGNAPAVVTDKYIRLPYIPAQVDSDLVPWGHATGAGLQVGDFLKPDAKGQFVKWVEGVDSINQRVGQILAVDFNQESLGNLKMAMWSEAEKYADEAFQNYYNKIPNSQPDYGYPYTGEYPDGTINMEKYGYMSEYQKIWTGIPGLTDGQGRQLNRNTDQLVGQVPAGAAGTAYVFQIKDTAGGNVINVIKSDDPTIGFELKVNGVVVNEGIGDGEYQINYKTGQIVYRATGAEVDFNVEASFCLYYYGTQSYIDFKGSIGVVNVLLKM